MGESLPSAVELFDKHADLYAEKYMDVSRYQEGFEELLKLLPKKAKLLEVACGPGNNARYLLDRRPDLNFHATDLSEKMVAIATRNLPEGELKLADAHKLNAIGTGYDALIAAFIFPYFDKDECLSWIRNSTKALKQNGLLYISTMEGNYVDSGLLRSSKGDELLTYYYDESFLTTALNEHGFEVLFQERVKNENGFDLILLAQVMQ